VVLICNFSLNIRHRCHAKTSLLRQHACYLSARQGKQYTRRASSKSFSLRGSGAARGGGRRESSPYGWTSKNMQYVCAFIVMELLRIARQIHCKAVKQRATLIHRQYNRDWGTSYSRPPIHPYLTSPRLLENPGGATVTRNNTRNKYELS